MAGGLLDHRSSPFMITLGLLKTEFAEYMANNAISSRMAEWVHWVATDIVGSYPFWWNKDTKTLTTVDGTNTYFLSPRVNMKDVSYMGDTSRRGFEITEVDMEQIYTTDPGFSQEGPPRHWAFRDVVEVQNNNTATTASAVSSSNADLSKTLIIGGQVSSVERYETISLNGTTTATASSPLTWDASSVLSVELQDTCAGVVTVTIGNTIASIPPGHRRLQIPRIILWPTPDSALSLPYIFHKNILPPVSDASIIDLPDYAFDALRKGLDAIGMRNNGDYNLAWNADSVYVRAKRDLYNVSTKNLNKVFRKDFGDRNYGDPVGVLPRLIVGSVTE